VEPSGLLVVDAVHLDPYMAAYVDRRLEPPIGLGWSVPAPVGRAWAARSRA